MPAARRSAGKDRRGEYQDVSYRTLVAGEGGVAMQARWRMAVATARPASSRPDSPGQPEAQRARSFSRIGMVLRQDARFTVAGGPWRL